MKYFSSYPKVSYKASNNRIVSMTNIFLKPKISIQNVPGINVYGNQYVIEDGESPDSLAKTIYQDSNSFWFLLMANNILDFYRQWPVSYDLWKRQILDIEGDYTFYIPYNMNIKTGDVVAKYIKETSSFDKRNFGVIIDVDSFMRSFDVDFLEGEIKQDDLFVILRKNGIRYDVIKTPTGIDYQTLKKRQDKLKSTVEFMAQYPKNKDKIVISPYLIFDQNSSIPRTVVDITGTGCVLDKFIQGTLSENINQISFTEYSQKEWIFNKTIDIFKPSTGLESLYLTAFN